MQPTMAPPTAGAPVRPNFENMGAPGGPDVNERNMDGPKVPLTELFSFVRHSKFSLLKDAVDYLPTKSFDKSLVQVFYKRSILSSIN
jgi:hypothetical protein